MIPRGGTNGFRRCWAESSAASPCFGLVMGPSAGANGKPGAGSTRSGERQSSSPGQLPRGCAGATAAGPAQGRCGRTGSRAPLVGPRRRVGTTGKARARRPGAGCSRHGRGGRRRGQARSRAEAGSWGAWPHTGRGHRQPQAQAMGSGRREQPTAGVEAAQAAGPSTTGCVHWLCVQPLV